MFYITTKLNPRQYEQITFEDFFSGKGLNPKKVRYQNYVRTRTLCYQQIPQDLKTKTPVQFFVDCLNGFNEKWAHLINTTDKPSLYRSFKIPKHSGGLRQIDAPKDDLMWALRELKHLFEVRFCADNIYHDSAFAYIKNRNPKIALERHKANTSHWFLREDCSNFFGSITPEFTMSQLAMIYPFCEIIENTNGRCALEKALSLCFLNGGLPQGTPISPLLTNIIMVPIDFQICKYIRDNELKMVYTRYADDMLISRYETFDWRQFQTQILKIFGDFNAPFTLNTKKTRYASSSGSNWNLGLMLNKDNEITLGHQKKKQLKVMLHSIFTAPENWSPSDANELQGIVAYHRSIEKEYTEKTIRDYEQKFGNGKTFKEILKSVMSSIN